MKKYAPRQDMVNLKGSGMVGAKLTSSSANTYHSLLAQEGKYAMNSNSFKYYQSQNSMSVGQYNHQVRQLNAELKVIRDNHFKALYSQQINTLGDSEKLAKYQQIEKSLSHLEAPVIKEIKSSYEKLDLATKGQEYIDRLVIHLGKYFKYFDAQDNISSSTVITLKESVFNPDILEPAVQVPSPPPKDNVSIDTGANLTNPIIQEQPIDTGQFLSGGEQNISANSSLSPILHANVSPVVSNSSAQQLISEIQHNIPEGLEELHINEMLEDLVVNSQSSSGNAPVSNQEMDDVKEELNALRAALDEYQSATSEEKQELKDQIDWLKTVLERHGKQLENVVTSFEQSNEKLQDYYNGFVSAFTDAFISAKSVTGGQLKLEGTKSMGVKAAVYLLKLVPVVGEAASSALQSAADYKAGVETKGICNNINKFGGSVTSLEKWAKYMANSIALEEELSEVIENYEKPTEEGMLAKLKQFAKDKQAGMDNAIAMDEIGLQEVSLQEFLGNEHAKKILESYICNGKFFGMATKGKERADELVKQFITDNYPDIANASQAEEEEQVPLDNSMNIQLQPHQINFDVGSEDEIEGSQSHIGGMNALEQHEQELTPKSKKIKEIEDQMAQMQAMFQAQLVQKENEILQLKENPPVNEDMISRAEVEEIISTNDSNLKSLKDKMTSVQQESLAKDEIIQERDNTLQEKDRINNDQKREIDNANRTIVRQDQTIDDLREYKDNLKHQLQEQKQLVIELKDSGMQKDAEIEILKKTVADLQVDKSNSSTVIINLSDVDGSNLPGEQPPHDVEQQLAGQNGIDF